MESEIRREDEVQKAGTERSLVEEAIREAHSERKKASTALEHLSRDNAKWEKHGASARRWQECRKWQAITPDELQPAVEAIRHRVEHYGCWQSNQSTMKLCYAALHPPPAINSDRVDAEYGQLTEHLPQVLPQLPVQCLPAALRNQHQMVFAPPLRMA